jgi:hypothetical protein
VDATTADTTGLIGIASSTVAAAGSVLVNVYGTASCVFDGATTAGHYVQASTTVAGNCRDAGASYPTSNQVVGFVLSTNASAGTYTVFLFGVEIRGTAPDAVTSVFGRTGAVTAAANDYNFNQLAGGLASTQDYTVGAAGTYTKVTTNAQGRVSSGATAAASDLSNGVQGSGAIVLGTSPTITTPAIAQINDTNGNAYLKSTATASAVDQVTITNAATGNPATVKIGATGTDANITLELDQKGTGHINAQVGATSFQMNGINTVVAAASDFTTAANNSLQTITGLTWTLPANIAENVPFECHLAYSQATATAAVSFGIQSATIAPTNIFATGLMTTAAAAQTSGNLPTLSTTTATAIVTATPSAITTVWGIDLSGYIENPSNASANVINIMVKTATAADAVTVKRGSFCKVF